MSSPRNRQARPVSRARRLSRARPNRQTLWTSVSNPTCGALKRTLRSWLLFNTRSTISAAEFLCGREAQNLGF